MHITRLFKYLAHISKLAKQKNDLNTALKAVESQMKILQELKKNASMDVKLMDEVEIDQLLQSTQSALEKSK